MGVLLVLTALSIGMQTDHLARGPATISIPQHYRVVEVIFCALFSMEIAVRIFVFGARYVSMPGWRWNIFDALVVFLQVTEEVVVASAGPEHMDGSMGRNALLLRLTRLVRIMRVVRFLRFLRIVSELHVLVCSIAASLRSFFWTAVLLSVMMYVVGVFFTQMVIEFREQQPDRYDDNVEMQLYWGSLGDSILSLFQSMSGGVDWEAVVIPLRSSLGDWIVVVYSLYIAFATLVMLNLVTGIFVQSAQENIRFSKDMELVNRVHELCTSSDENKSGIIQREEFERQIDNPSMAQYLKAVDLHASEVSLLFKLLDVEGHGEIGSDDLINGCLRLQGSARAVEVAVMAHNSRAMFRWILEHLGAVEEQIRALSAQLSNQYVSTQPASVIDEEEPWAPEPLSGPIPPPRASSSQVMASPRLTARRDVRSPTS